MLCALSEDCSEYGDSAGAEAGELAESDDDESLSFG